MLELIKRTQIKSGKWYGIYKCVCGTEKEIRISAVNEGSTKSCGCHRKAICKKTGESAKTHGKSDSKEHSVWSLLKQYSNPTCKSYKGLSICEEWNSFEIFDKWYQSNKEGDKIISWSGDHISPETCYFEDKNKAKNDKTKYTNLKRYGVESPQSLQEIKDKIAKTNMEKYGFKAPSMSQEIKDKAYSTSVERYGEHHTKIKSIKDKIKNTNLEKYGFACSFQNEDVKKKFRDNYLLKHGVEHPMKLNIIRQRVSSSVYKKYGVYHSTQLPQCRFTAGSYSKPELEIQSFLLDNGIEFKKNREALNGKEIDLYNEKLKLGIEYCGLYWHTDRTLDKDNHYQKMKDCRDQGIKLITIFADEWKDRKRQIKNHLKSLIGVNERIFARKCSIKDVPYKDAISFINENHIQSISKKPLLSLGLYTDELVSVMTFDKHHRGLDRVILNRFCSKSGFSIVGGASRLLKYASKTFPEIWSWSDNRYSDGNVYQKLGFELVQELKPDYSYVDLSKKTRYSKQSMQKSKIGCPPEITEKQFLQDLGYYRIWDCGKKTWKFSV